MNIPNISCEPKGDAGRNETFPRWNMASCEQKKSYMMEVERDLLRLEFTNCVVNCDDVHYTNKELDLVMLDALKTVEEVGDTQIPKPRTDGKQRPKKVVNWKGEIEPFKYKAHFWHAVWVSAGRPINCELHNLMKKTRNVYHLHIRKGRRLLERIKKNELLTACMENKTDLFDAIKRERRSKRTYATTMDGRTEDIPDHLAATYEKLYNSTDEKDEFSSIEISLETSVGATSLQDISCVRWNTVKNCAHKLKSRKTDPFLKISSLFGS